MGAILMILKKTIFLLSLIICFSCNKRELVKSIHSKELINLDYKRLTKIDSLAAYELLSENPTLFNWPQTLDLLKRIMPKEYLSENLDDEKDKAIRDFLKNNRLFSYSLKVNEEIFSTIITKSVHEPAEWMDKGYYMNMFLVKVKNKLEKPILINSYVHIMGVTEMEKESITELYSDHTVKVKIKNEHCSDAIIGDKITCDSTSILNFYTINSDTGDVKFTSDTIRSQFKL